MMIAWFAPAQPVTAQEDDVSGLLRLVNELRASSGLDPYSVDPGLMAFAQEHSEYQAAIHTSTHQHSDGRDPPDIGVVENVAGGDIGYLDPYAAVYEIWADPVHMRAMIGCPGGAMEVGVADDGRSLAMDERYGPLPCLMAFRSIRSGRGTISPATQAISMSGNICSSAQLTW